MILSKKDLEENFNPKIMIEHFCPNLLRLHSLSSKDWKKIKTQIIESVHRSYHKLSKHEEISKKTTFFDLVKKAHDGNSYSKFFLKFIDNISSELSTLIKNMNHISFRSIIFDLLNNYNPEGNESHYRERIGELAVLHQILKHSNYELEAFEDISETKKPIDFRFKKIADQPYLIEVVNIFLDDTSNLSNTEIKNIITSKISQKLTEKKLDSNFSKSVALISVIWIKLEIIISNFDFFKKYKHESYNTIYLCCIYQKTLPCGEKIFKINLIDKIIDDYNSLSTQHK